ncbi:16S rRNA (guanine(966)-N(2))-methyltransferase RsmD [Plasticicumulans sp.]|uniref:16S rRNA (guanine(966)-N(2))-methyltransferase RsmD n=2 Tax=Plasticicumulans sp. TaxID=2307179 RepID=UPI0039224DCF
MPRSPRPSNLLRVLGGRFRGRRLAFPDAPGLRPTPDRVRETLFNWLMPVIDGARCLDLFAGSGALGIEALSRGARLVQFVEREPAVARALAANLALLGAGDTAALATRDALAWLDGPAQPFDVVFLDPPFHHGLLPAVCERLAAGWLAPQARVYLESESESGSGQGGADALPPGWTLLRERTAGQVRYRLVTPSA